MDKREFVKIGAEPCPTPDNGTLNASIRPIPQERNAEYYHLMTRLHMTSSVEEQTMLTLALNAIIFGNS